MENTKLGSFVPHDGFDIPLYGLDNGLFYALHIPAVVCVSVSLICAAVAIIISFRRHGDQAFFAWSKCDRFVVYLAICDGLFNLAHGSDHLHVIITKKHVYPKELCHLYGFMTSIFVTAQNLLVAAIAVNIFVMMYFQKKPKFGRNDWIFITITFGVPVAAATIAWCLGKLGPNGMFCLTDGINGWITYVTIFTAPLLIIFVMNTTLYLLTCWKIRSEVRIIRKSFGQDMRNNNTVSAIRAAKNMSLFVAAFFIQWFTAALFGAWSLFGVVPVAMFHINTTLTNLGGLLNLGVFFLVNRKRGTRTSTQKCSGILNNSQSQGTVSSFTESRIGDSTQTVSPVTN